MAIYQMLLSFYQLSRCFLGPDINFYLGTRIVESILLRRKASQIFNIVYQEESNHFDCCFMAFFMGSYSIVLANPIYEWSPIFLNCRAIFKDEQAMRISYLSFGCLFIVPMLLVILCYSSIHHFIRHHNNAIVPSLQQNNSQATRIQEIKTCRVVFVAVLGFCLCWSPVISTMVLQFGFQIPICPSVLSICFLLTSASAYINPLIYGVMNQTMRVEFLEILSLRSG